MNDAFLHEWQDVYSTCERCAKWTSRSDFRDRSDFRAVWTQPWWLFFPSFLVIRCQNCCCLLRSLLLCKHFFVVAFLCCDPLLQLFSDTPNGNGDVYLSGVTSPSLMSWQDNSLPCCCYSCCPVDQLITNVWLSLRNQSVSRAGLISPAGGPLKPNHQKEKKKITERWESFVPPHRAVWSALILRTVFTFFASFCSSACWKWFIPMACRVHTVGIQLRHPGGERARVLRESPSGSMWHVDPDFLPGSMGMCSVVYAAAAIHLTVCPIVSIRGNSENRMNHSQTGQYGTKQ